MDIFSTAAFIALAQVIGVNLVLSGDNAVVIGMVAARVAPGRRAKVILWGLVAAVVLRLAFAVVAVRLLEIIGLTLAGGILLLWVCWRLYRDIRESKDEDTGAAALAAGSDEAYADQAAGARGMTMGDAIVRVALADISMSLDNVLAVAGAADQHLWVLVLGLVLSIAFMGLAAGVIASFLQRYHWLSYIGLALIFYIALAMIWKGGWQVAAAAAAGL